jgi:uncharacterized membrane protein YjfL (UPF0719 family)
MGELGPVVPYYITVLLWLARTAFFAFVCAFLLWLGVLILDALTPHIHERKKIGENSIATGLYIGGFLICIGLVIHGASTLPTLVGASPWLAVFNPIRLVLIAAGFFLSLLVGIVILNSLIWLSPRISFKTLGQEPVGAGVYVFSYLVFFGLIMHAALTTPL